LQLANSTLDARKDFSASRRVPAAALLAVLALGSARAQPSCPSLPPPGGATIEVTPGEADDLRAIVAGAATGRNASATFTALSAAFRLGTV